MMLMKSVAVVEVSSVRSYITYVSFALSYSPYSGLYWLGLPCGRTPIKFPVGCEIRTIHR